MTNPEAVEISNVVPMSAPIRAVLSPDEVAAQQSILAIERLVTLMGFGGVLAMLALHAEEKSLEYKANGLIAHQRVLEVLASRTEILRVFASGNRV
jgi:hypothetical protein